MEDRRRSTTPEHVEMLSLIKNWEEGDKSEQHRIENNELEEKMANMYLNGLESDGA